MGWLVSNHQIPRGMPFFLRTDLCKSLIYVNATATKDERHAVIVEVTPRVRYLRQQQGVDWSTETLAREYTGKHVRITGWLFYDAEHENAAENIESRPNNWRGTCWEIHPVTAIDLLP